MKASILEIPEADQLRTHLDRTISEYRRVWATHSTPDDLWPLQHRHLAQFLGWLARRYGGSPDLATGRICHTRLIPYGRCQAKCHAGKLTHGSGPGKQPCLPPYADHSRAWSIGGKVIAVTTEPYDGGSYDSGSTPGSRTGPDIDQWAQQHGLELHVSTCSFWNPATLPDYYGGTVLMALTARERGQLPILVDEPIPGLITMGREITL